MHVCTFCIKSSGRNALLIVSQTDEDTFGFHLIPRSAGSLIIDHYKRHYVFVKFDSAIQR